jgi:serine/threonine protein kinase
VVPQVISHYRVIKKIGAGGMSEVYLATDSVLGRNVALKVLSQEALVGDYPKERFMREAQSIAKLDHPNICSVYEAGSDCELNFIVMQYIEGETLVSRIRCNPGLEDVRLAYFP